MKFSRLAIFILILFAFPFVLSSQKAVSASTTDNISDDEIAMLVRGYSEEKLARDVYTYLADIYDIAVFPNIAKAENRHVAVMEGLLNTYNIDVPTGYGPYEEEFVDLKAKGKNSLKDAIEVGLMIEILDIKDLDKTIAATKNETISIPYSNLRQASVNHLNAFVRNMEYHGFTTDLEWQKYATLDATPGNKNGMRQTKGKGNSNMNQKKTQKKDCSLTCPKASTCKKIKS